MKLPKLPHMKNILRSAILFFVVQISYAQKMNTLTYAKNDTIQLDLDFFVPEKASKEKMPLVIYVHGGGFSGGERESGHSLCNYLSANGFATATISYSLYAKGKNFNCDGALPNKIKAFQHGANGVWLATSFFIKNAKKYNIDPSKIFIAGSSAGAESVLHAAYWDIKTMNLYKNTLPKDFKYAGLISGAGAIMDLNLITQKNLIPMMFFHGSGDVTVPYGTAVHHLCKVNSSNWLMLFGSYSIYNYALQLNGSASLFTYCNGGHEYSGTLFEKDQSYILGFLNDVLAGKKVQQHTVFKTNKKLPKGEKGYSFCD